MFVYENEKNMIQGDRSEEERKNTNILFHITARTMDN